VLRSVLVSRCFETTKLCGFGIGMPVIYEAMTTSQEVDDKRSKKLRFNWKTMSSEVSFNSTVKNPSTGYAEYGFRKSGFITNLLATEHLPVAHGEVYRRSQRAVKCNNPLLEMDSYNGGFEHLLYMHERYLPLAAFPMNQHLGCNSRQFAFRDPSVRHDSPGSYDYLVPTHVNTPVVPSKAGAQAGSFPDDAGTMVAAPHYHGDKDMIVEAMCSLPTDAHPCGRVIAFMGHPYMNIEAFVGIMESQLQIGEQWRFFNGIPIKPPTKTVITESRGCDAIEPSTSTPDYRNCEPVQEQVSLRQPPSEHHLLREAGCWGQIESTRTCGAQHTLVPNKPVYLVPSIELNYEPTVNEWRHPASVSPASLNISHVLKAFSHTHAIDRRIESYLAMGHMRGRSNFKDV